MASSEIAMLHDDITGEERGKLDKAIFVQFKEGGPWIKFIAKPDDPSGVPLIEALNSLFGPDGMSISNMVWRKPCGVELKDLMEDDPAGLLNQVIRRIQKLSVEWPTKEEYRKEQMTKDIRDFLKELASVNITNPTVRNANWVRIKDFMEKILSGFQSISS